MLKHPKAGAFEIVALVRNADKARILESKFNVKAVVGSHQDLDKIHELVAKSDFVFHLVRTSVLTGNAHDPDASTTRRTRMTSL